MLMIDTLNTEGSGAEMFFSTEGQPHSRLTLEC